MTKKVSIVLTGKNDDYGGHFDERLILTTKYNIKKLNSRNIDVELVFVEWNPISDKPLLSEKLVDTFDDVKCYVIEEVEHNLMRTENEYMTFLEFFAKNVGIRRSTGDLIIATNADVFYSESVIDGIANIDTSVHNVFYRAERKDIKFNRLKGLGDNFFNQATFRTNPIGSKPYIDASGDFTMATKKTFENIDGYDENMNFVKIHKDSRILFSALEKGFDFSLLGDIYHIDHEGSAVGTTGTLSNYRKTNGPYSWFYIKNLPYANNEDWGMVGDNFLETQVQNNITKIHIKDSTRLSFDNDAYRVQTQQDADEMLIALKEFYNKHNLR